MNKKKIDTKQMRTELEQSSSFFASEKEVKKEKPQAKKNVSTKERPVVHPDERTKTRHSFDVFTDQLISLKRIQLEREVTLGKRYRLGDLVQEALDMLITKERNNV